MARDAEGWIGSPIFAACATLPLLCYAAYRASVDLDPPSLWIDDLWIVALSQSWTLDAWLASPASAPPGFKALIGAALALGSDVELSAQALPFLFGLLGIALTAALAFRLSSNAVVATAAAAIVAYDRVFLTYMARVKPYTLDVVLVASLGLCFHALIERYERRRLWGFVAVSAAGLALSSLALFPVAAASAVAGWVLWRRGVRDQQLLAAGAALGMLAAGVSGLALFAQGFGELQGFWEERYLRTEGAGAWGAMLFDVLRGWVARWMNVGELHSFGLPAEEVTASVAGAFLTLVGCAELWRSGQRAHLAVGLVLVATVLAASAAGRLPVGVQRIETFLLPFGAVAIGLSLGAADRLASARAALAASVLIFAVLLAQLPGPRRPTYRAEISAPLVARLAQELGPRDGLWTNIHGTFALAVYGPWRVRYAQNERLGIPHAVLELEHFSIMNLRSSRIDQPPPRTERIFVFACHDLMDRHGSAVRRLEAAGYTSRTAERRPGCALELMVREQ
jgi:hypothetical protein